MGVPNVTQLPQRWVDALNAAVAAGNIPNIPVSSNQPNTNPVYPQGFDPNGPQVCSASYKCRSPGDIWDAPAGVFASAFDDGPLPVCSMPASL
jgi:chitin deacetylase